MSQDDPMGRARGLADEARGALRGGDWGGAVDAARRSNQLLFSAGAPQSSPLVGANYALAARGLLGLREWHEAEILAGLSLQGLTDWTGDPGRAEATLILAQARRRRGNLPGARETLAEVLGAGLGALREAGLEAEALELEGKLRARESGGAT